MSEFYKVKLIEIKKLTKNTSAFIFSTENKKFKFLPGQFITVKIGNETRDFSIASSPSEKNIIMIVTKRGESLFKKKLFKLKLGEFVEITSPSGGFIFDEKNTTPQVFIAGGIGVTPFHSFLKYAKNKNLTNEIILFVSFSKVDDIIFFDELKIIEEEFKNIKIIYTISRDDKNWTGEKGRINDFLLKNYVSNLFESTYYIVGKVEMVDAINEILLKLGVSSEQIKIEYFTGY